MERHMSEFIEKAAEALYGAIQHNLPVAPTWNDLWHEHKQTYRRTARAVIEAIDPTAIIARQKQEIDDLYRTLAGLMFASGATITAAREADPSTGSTINVTGRAT